MYVSDRTGNVEEPDMSFRIYTRIDGRHTEILQLPPMSMPPMSIPLDMPVLDDIAAMAVEVPMAISEVAEAILGIIDDDPMSMVTVSGL